MGVETFVLALFVGAAALALWFEVRLGDRSPTSIPRIVLHVIVAMVVLQVARSVVAVTIEPGEAVRTMAVLFGAVLPALVYVFMASLWMMKVVRSALPR